MSRMRGILAGLGVALLLASPALSAQSVSVEGPAGSPLPSLTPAFTVRASGFGAARPLRITVLVGTSADFLAGVVADTAIVTSDTVVAVQLLRALPSDGVVFWKARVEAPGITAESAVTGPRIVPSWLTLVSPNSPSGDIVDARRPTLTWRSARLDARAGPWKYEVEVLSQGRPEQAATGIRDTTWRPPTDLQANTPYRWRVRATLPTGASVQATSAGTFLVKDQPFPAVTLLYPNFPNPFPTATAFATCIWFDVAAPGARIALDVTDLRGNLVRQLIPGPDGQQDFLPGRYGQGEPGTGSSCSNRFIWDGTGNDGRTVAPGVYLLRFRSGLQRATFQRMLFLGR